MSTAATELAALLPGLTADIERMRSLMGPSADTCWHRIARAAELLQERFNKRADLEAQIADLRQRLDDQDIDGCHDALTAAGIAAGSLIERVEDLIGDHVAALARVTEPEATLRDRG